ncbi:putative thiazole-containing bacteriocin maturation protein [Desmospora activa DSM 45169]|uniref:Putative thiazole-containing bacteriocin maturation protein n=1 Tax=Desmospora activa DSM 45169 TaxID=1121389 RepID=A0A2T4ZAX5_9BACL|nr:putative thiazole-containing bacteriocin maturation protein [Desmospora activa DSM 45169]
MNLSMRLKVKADTFYLPNPNGGVYFCNNEGSFRLQGQTIDRWIEKLFPVFNGEHTLEELTQGLPEPHQKRIIEIAEVLFNHGFARDVSQEHPHQLPQAILTKAASQIEFLDHFGGSGAFRFQAYRQAKVLAVGSGSFLISLVRALFESGLSRFHLLITDAEPTNRERIAELTTVAAQSDPTVAVEEIALEAESSWRDAVQPFDTVLYVSQQGDMAELRALNESCREEEKVFLPAIALKGMGLAGPLVHPDSTGCWESAWRRLHRTALEKESCAISSTAAAMLANVIVFEWMKQVTGVATKQENQLFLLDLETLEGDWHSYLPHPLVGEQAVIGQVQDLEWRLQEGSDKRDSNELLFHFSRLTSTQVGVFHIWEEGELQQLPLAQCRVQVVDPLSEGPAERLPAIIRTGFTHEEARREAGLAGLEAYLSRISSKLVDGVKQSGMFGVGVGETAAEALWRGIEKCLTKNLYQRLAKWKPTIDHVQLDAVEDERCRFYIETLTNMRGSPLIGLGEELFQFPVVWVGAGGRWYGSVGLNHTEALRKSLQQAVSHAQNEEGPLTIQALADADVHLTEKAKQRLVIPASEGGPKVAELQSVLPDLQRDGKQLLVFDLAIESFLKEEWAAVFGVWLQEEESR